MSLSEATKQATREEWRELGFYYETRDDPLCWRFVGSRSGLGNLVKLLDEYVRDPANRVISEHQHYGPYMYLKVQTAESAEIDNESIRGSLADLAHLRDLVADALKIHRPGDSFRIGSEYSPAVTLPLHFEICEEGFDPASVPSDQDLSTLRRWERRMIGLFTATWAYFLLVVAVNVVMQPPPEIIQWALLPAVFLIVAAGFLQFSARCPSCGYRLGRQSRLVVPELCRSCSVPLRPQPGGGAR